jgi:hypothetical protein
LTGITRTAPEAATASRRIRTVKTISIWLV